MQHTLDQLIGHGPVHFIGIGGISMSCLARILLDRGIPVTGSDRSDSDAIEGLRTLGARVNVPHDASCIGNQTLVVYTAAIASDNPELLEAQRQGIACMDRGHFLGQLALGYDRNFAVSGTHGKTTSTGMLASVLLEAGTDPTIHIGGILPLIGGNTRIGGRSTFLMEACEYKNSYHGFYPTHALILNIEADHLDFFRDLDDILDSFATYTRNIAPDGELVLNLDDAGCRSLAARIDRPYAAYRMATADAGVLPGACPPVALYQAEQVTYEQGRGRFDVLLGQTRLATVTLSVPGPHNVSNALGCFALAHRAGLPAETIAYGLSHFTGTGRRFEAKGTVKGATLIDDYAHHPTAVELNLSTARALARGRIVCVFQPHTYTRTLKLLPEFSQALAQADLAIIVDIYAAREPDQGQIHARDLVEGIRTCGGDARYAASFEEAARMAADGLAADDLVMTMGAGDVYRVGDHMRAFGA